MSTPEAPALAKGARVFPIPPPLYYGAAFAAGMFVQKAVPLDVPARPASALVGAILVVVGLALDAAGVATVIAHHTTIVPHRPVATLITSGVYRFSRNPMYTGLAIVVTGGAVLASTGGRSSFCPWPCSV
ncbi:MAG TPA: methyltransferase [Acidimicrobiales bacterium]|nr:methyltransferase [Acidimicrobiales bacterium]